MYRNPLAQSIAIKRNRQLKVLLFDGVGAADDVKVSLVTV